MTELCEKCGGANWCCNISPQATTAILRRDCGYSNALLTPYNQALELLLEVSEFQCKNGSHYSKAERLKILTAIQIIRRRRLVSL